MSTKVYQAWKFHADRLNDFLEWYDALARPKLRARFDALVKQRLCLHPDDRVRLLAVYDAPADPPERRRAEGQCRDCGRTLPGTALPAPGVPPVNPERNFRALMAMVGRAQGGEAVGTDPVWERPPPPKRPVAIVQGASEDLMTRFEVECDLLTECAEAAFRYGRNAGLDLEAGVSLRLLNGFWYAVPRGELWTRPEEGARPAFAEEYAYWDNTDPPEWAQDANPDAWKNVPGARHGPGYARWEERGDAWGRAFGATSTAVGGLWVEHWTLDLLRGRTHISGWLHKAWRDRAEPEPTI